MKVLLLLLFVFLIGASGVPQNNPPAMPPGMTPEMLEKIKKMIPPGTILPPGMEQYGNTGESGGVKPLIQMPPVQTYEYNSQSSGGGTTPVFGSGRNEAQRKAAVDAVDAELELKPYILPKKEDAPTKSFMLHLAETRSKAAHQKFGADDLSAFSQVITWIPSFDGHFPEPEKAMKMSLLVSTSTNYLNLPQFILAVSSAVFALDPESSNNANNFASAIITAGERLNPPPMKVEALAPFRKDAESAFLYAMAISMKDDAWNSESVTPILNLGNLYIDMRKLEEARSLFQVARKLDPLSWDAALGMAAYFHAIGQPDKALAILEDDKLNKPVSLMIAKKSAKAFEKSEPFVDLPVDAPEEKFEKGIETVATEPIMTSADFIAQIDQSERNKMRYFIEHLPPAGSYTVPKINKLTQYSTLKAMSGPQGVSALKDFVDMVGNFTLTSAASTSKQQIEWLAKMGLKIDPGVDMEDVAKHPEKYKDKHIENNVKVTGKDEFLANLQQMSKQAQVAERDLAAGKTSTLIEMAGKVDPFFNILLIDPEQYADPMNILIQQHNFAVYNRKKHLYEGYLYKVNKKTYQYVMDDVQKAQKKIGELTKMENEELDAFEKQYEAAKKQNSMGTFPDAEWKLRRHNIHTKYFQQFNNAAEIGFGSATNTASIAYVQRIKPTAEGYYYDVIRHIALISDPEVRDQKDTELKSTINSAVTWALQTVMIAHGSFSYSDDWDCTCDVEALIRQREEEDKAIHEEENARIMRNKAAKAMFDSGEIPKSSPLWKKLDSFVDEYNLGFIKVRSSCAQTVVKLNTDILPIPGIPKLFGSMTTSENTGATEYEGGIKVGIGVQKDGVNVGANIGLSGTVSTDGQGVVKDYSVTPSADLSVKVGNTGVSVGGSLTFDKNGDVRDSDFSAGVSQDFKNGYGTEGNVGFEASTKRGCSLSGKVAHDVSVKPPKDPNDKSNEDKIKPADNTEGKFFKKTLWSGKYELKL
jgi:tetratricopeptide (TPR) repeat protein